MITPLPAGALSALAVMHQACFPEDPWNAEALGRILALSGCFGHLAWDGDDPAGFVLARDLGDEIEILSLGVLPERRRNGCARGLLEVLIAEARRRRTRSIVLEVAAENLAARQLYRGMGFFPVGRRPRYYRVAGGARDALILRRATTGDAISE